MGAAVPHIANIPGIYAANEGKLCHKIYLTELVLLNQNHNWRQVASCFKNSAHVKRGNCRYCFSRNFQNKAEIREDGVLLCERTIGSEYINNFNPILLQIVRSNHDIRFLTGSVHEMYYVFKYVVKNQTSIDNIAAITLTASVKKLEKEKQSTEERSKSHWYMGE